VVLVPLEFAPPKYVLMVNAIQERIGNGTYPAGTMIPSESQLMAEFGASRPTVVRALGILQQDGWIEPRAGVGRFVRSRPSMTARQAPSRAVELLAGDEAAGVKLLKVGPVLAPQRAASALNVPAGSPLIARERLVVAEEVGPIELATTYVPVELAARTDVGNGMPLHEPLLDHLTRRAAVTFDHATERISARRPDKAEAQLLDMDPAGTVLTLLVTVFDLSGTPRVAVDAILPASRHELEDAFPLR
jgi:GntR family transcriptional regulator